jgi:hypothetical protein
MVFKQGTRYSCQILMKLEFYRQVFEKYTNIKFHDHPFSGSRVVPRERTDGQLIVIFTVSSVYFYSLSLYVPTNAPSLL